MRRFYPRAEDCGSALRQAVFSRKSLIRQRPDVIADLFINLFGPPKIWACRPPKIKFSTELSTENVDIYNSQFAVCRRARSADIGGSSRITKNGWYRPALGNKSDGSVTIDVFDAILRRQGCQGEQLASLLSPRRLRIFLLDYGRLMGDRKSVGAMKLSTHAEADSLIAPLKDIDPLSC